MTDVNPEPCAIDEQMHRPIGRRPVELNLTKLLQAPRQRRVIGDWQVHVQHLCQGIQEAFCLAQRKAENHADR